MVDIEQLRLKVTHFSEEIRLKAENLQEVVIGGKISRITNPIRSSMNLSLYDSSEKALECFYCVDIDDQVGEMQVYVSPFLMDHFRNVIQVNHHVLFQGFVKTVSRQIRGKTKKDISVVAYNAKTIEG